MPQRNNFDVEWERLKKKIEKMKEQLSSLKAKKEILMQKIEKEYGLKTVFDVEKEYESLKEKIDELETQKENLIDEIEELLDEMAGD